MDDINYNLVGLSTQDLLDELNKRFDTIIFAGRQLKYSTQIPLKEILHYNGVYSEANMLADQIKIKIMCDYQAGMSPCGDG